MPMGKQGCGMSCPTVLFPGGTNRFGAPPTTMLAVSPHIMRFWFIRQNPSALHYVLQALGQLVRLDHHRQTNKQSSSCKPTVRCLNTYHQNKASSLSLGCRMLPCSNPIVLAREVAVWEGCHHGDEDKGAKEQNKPSKALEVIH